MLVKVFFCDYSVIIFFFEGNRYLIVIKYREVFKKMMVDREESLMVYVIKEVKVIKLYFDFF